MNTANKCYEGGIMNAVRGAVRLGNVGGNVWRNGWGKQKQLNTLNSARGMLHDTAQKLLSMVWMRNISLESLVRL